MVIASKVLKGFEFSNEFIAGEWFLFELGDGVLSLCFFILFEEACVEFFHEGGEGWEVIGGGVGVELADDLVDLVIHPSFSVAFPHEREDIQDFVLIIDEVSRWFKWNPERPKLVFRSILSGL